MSRPKIEKHLHQDWWKLYQAIITAFTILRILLTL